MTGRRRALRLAALWAAGMALGACGASSPTVPSPAPDQTANETFSAETARTSQAATPTVEPAASATPPASPVAAPSWEPDWVEVRYRVEDRTAAPEQNAFADTLQAVLTDPRGWARARYRFIADPAGPYRIVLAEGPEVDELCRPLDTMSTYSCQNGPVVALNADRWRGATPQWPADLASYRAMLINHEVGHLLHLHHPRPQCPGPGLPAPVMAQQSTELGDCLPNPWPLQWEVDLALRRAEPLAPPAEHDPADHRPTAPPARS